MYLGGIIIEIKIGVIKFLLTQRTLNRFTAQIQRSDPKCKYY